MANDGSTNNSAGIDVKEVANKVSTAVSPKEQLKAGLESVVPNLKPENFGSKWPKTTLAAVNDSAATMSLEQFRDLKRICQEYSSKLSGTSKKDICIPIKKISIVQYTCRSLEELESKAEVLLDEVEDQQMYQEASQEEKERTRSVVQEWDNETSYLEKVNAPGSRIGSYRQDSPSGETCVAFLGDLPSDLSKIMTDFQADIDRQFSGQYAWLEASSLHCTLRSLAQKEADS